VRQDRFGDGTLVDDVARLANALFEHKHVGPHSRSVGVAGVED